MALLKLNGQTYFINCETIEVNEISNGRWSVKYNLGNHEFIVVGGRKSGGARNEWFCYHPEFFGEDWIPTKSMIAAIKMGVQY